MADRSISVSLDFTANTNQAEIALKNLQSSLQNISNMSTIGQDARMAKNIEEASAAAMTLRNNLQAAFDQKTGSLNLSKLNEEMAKSGMSAEKYRTTLSAIGPQGRQAFMELANAVVASETPLRQTTGLVDKLWDSLKRTAGWQLSSSVIHGFMGAVQSAYGYAQDLNKSLNNIRIVTGYSTDEMAKFAEQANKAAKGLSSTTTDYTDAALIYYQQGIRDQSEIEGRVATTIKLANVSQQSAEEVSSQMTAIWNNFDDGSHSLEYYADVITALGAATASSSQEISQGLSKFAAVADTVGMSYEYATSALATIVATTRQSADTVGTGLRTLFSRLQGLKLGETLEDGVDLNKYSQALESVGVHALDASGELRQMDDILDDLGERWGDLSQAQQVALAQTVGGVRQYTNLVALMDNWDFMKENVGIAEGAEGTLQEQADIYAESWEAAQKRVRSAAESIYSDLLKDDFFIDITKLFAGILETVDQLIDAFGGLGGTLPLILTLMNKIFGEKMQAGAQRIAENLYYSTSKGKQERIDQDKDMKKQFVDQTKAMQKEGVGANEAATTEVGYNKITALQSEMIAKDQQLTEIERNLYKMAIDRAQALTKQTAELGKSADEARAIADAQKFDLMTGTEKTDANGNLKINQDFNNLNLIPNKQSQLLLSSTSNAGDTELVARELERILELGQNSIQTVGQLQTAYEQFANLNLKGTLSQDLDQIIEKNNQLASGQNLYQQIQQGLNSIHGSNIAEATAELKKLADQAGTAGQKIKQDLASKTNVSIGDVEQAFIKLGASVKKSNTDIQSNVQRLGKIIGQAYGFSEAEIEKFIQTTLKAAQAEKISAKGAEALKASLEHLSTSAGQAGNAMNSTSQKISNILGKLSGFGQAAMNISMLVSSAKGLANAFTAPDMSPWERISSIFMSLGMLIPSFISTFGMVSGVITKITSAFGLLNSVEAANLAIKEAHVITSMKSILAAKGLNAEKKKEHINSLLVKAGLTGETAAKIADIAVTKGLDAAMKELSLSIGAVLAELWPFLAIGALLAGVVVGIIAIIKHANDARDAAGNLAKQTAAEAAELTERYNEATRAVEDFKEAASDYQDAISAIDGLTEHTAAYKEAVDAANAKARELIETYGLYGDYTTENGIIKIDETALKTKQAELEGSASTLQIASAIGQISATKASITPEAQKLGEDVLNNYNYDEDYAYNGAKISQIVAESINQMKDEGKGTVDSDNQELRQLILDNFKAQSNGAGLGEWRIDTIMENIHSFESLAQTVSDADAKIAYFADQIYDAVPEKMYEEHPELRSAVDKATEIKDENGNVVKDDEGNVMHDEARKAAIEQAASKAQEKQDKQNQKELDQAIKDAGISDLSGDGSDLGDWLEKQGIAEDILNADDVYYDTDLHKMYAQKIFGADANKISEENGNGKGTVRDEKGNVIFENVDDEVMVRELATYALAEQLKRDQGTDAAANMTSTLTDLMQNRDFMTAGSEYGGNLSDVLLNTLGQDDITKFDLSGFKKQLDESEFNQIQSMSDAEIAEMFGVDEATLQELGYKDAHEFATSFKDSLGKEWDEDSYLQGLDENLNKEAKKAGFSDEELESIKKYSEYLQENNKYLKDNKEAANTAALNQARLDKGFASLSKNIGTYTKDLNKANKDTKSYSEALDGLKTDLSNLFDMDNLSDELIENIGNDAEAMALLQQGINGNEQAMEQFQALVAKKMTLGVDFDSRELDAAEQELANMIDQASQEDIEIGATFNDSQIIQGLYNAAIAAGQTTDQIQGMFDELGWEPELEERSYTLNEDDISNGYVTVPTAIDVGEDGAEITTSTTKIPITADMTAGSTITYPVIKGNKTHFTGNAAAKAASSGGKGGGGGGGGGGGDKKEKELSKADRSNRYHVVKKKQEKNNKKQEDANRKKERAFGAEKIKQAEEEIKLQKERIELQREYVDEVGNYLAKDRKDMEDLMSGIGISVKIDKDGIITNFDDIQQEILRQTNELEKQYNAGSLDDDAFEEAKKKLDEANEALNNYEETWALWDEGINTLQSELDELADKALDLTKLKVDMHIDVSGDAIEYIDYMLSKIEDDAYSVAKAIGLVGDKTEQTLQQIAFYRSGLSDILGEKGFSLSDLNNLTNEDLANANFTEKQIQQIREWRSALLEANQALLEMRTEQIDKLIDSFDQFNEKIQDSYSEFDYYNNVLENFMDITDLLGTKMNEQTKNVLKSIRTTQLANARNRAASAKEIYENAQKEYNDIKALYDRAVIDGDEEKAKEYERLMKDAEENAKESYLSWQEGYKEALEQARNIYEAEMEIIADDFENSLTGIYNSFELFDSAFERAKELEENYLEDYEKFYELSKLNRDIQKEIDNTSSIRDRKVLRDMQKEITRLQAEGVKLSQYDVEAMRKKFELEQARMNLEEARNNKSEVRLTRDQNGNWGYVYTASEDKVADAEQKYEDALYQYQKYTDEYIDNLEERMKNLPKTFWDAFYEIMESDEFQNDEQRAEAVQDLIDKMTANGQFLVSQFNAATGNASSVLDLFTSFYGQQGDITDSFLETILGATLKDYGSAEEFLNSILSQANKAYDETNKKRKEYDALREDISEKEGITFDEMAGKITEVGRSSDETKEKITDLITTTNTKFTEGLKALQDWEAKYAKLIEDAVKANETLIESLNLIIARLLMIESKDPALANALETYQQAQVAHQEFVKQNGDIRDEAWEKAKQDFNTAINTNIAKYDTGGYTGEWGDEGKIAILHEKEYVLNADLTARFFDALKTFSMLEDFMNTNEQFQQQQIQDQMINNLNHYIDQLANYMNTTSINPNDFSASLLDTGNQQLEQTVHIDANFPNVTSHDEIEMAFDNLVNKASQYINRKNMSSMTFQDSYLSPV